MEFSIADLDIGKTNYTSRIADPSKPIILLIHGFTASAKTYIPIIKMLNEDTNYLCFDFLGHGKSAQLPEAASMNYNLLIRQVDEILDHVLPPETRPKRHLELILVGHSQVGCFAPRYALLNPERIKKLVLITPGGIDFKLSDYFHSPFNLVVRSAYQIASSSKFGQRIILGFAFRLIALLCLLGKTLGIYLDQSFSLFSSMFTNPEYRLIMAQRIDILHDWIFNFNNFTSGEWRHHRRMIGEMIDNLDLIGNQKEMFQQVSRTGIPIELFLAESDFVVPMSAGIRLFKTMQTTIDSQIPSTCGLYPASKIPSPNFRFEEFCNDEIFYSDESSLYSDSSEELYEILNSSRLRLHILAGTHLLPVEHPQKLANVIMDY